MKQMRWISVIILLPVLLLSACAPAVPSTATPADQAAIPTAGQVARVALAKQLGIDPTQVKIESVNKVDWPDSCLGQPNADEICAQVITPGYEVKMTASGASFTYRTDEQGKTLRGSGMKPTAAAPTSPAAPLIGEGELQWQSSGDPCQQADFSADGFSFGPCAGQMQTVQFKTPERAAQLNHLVSTYAAFSAVTVAGTVTLRGSGQTQPTPAEQRAIAEWARSTATETGDGGFGTTGSGVLLTWERQGGIAGLCDRLDIYASGIARATSCKRGAPATAAAGGRLIYLTPSQLEMLYHMTDTFQQFEVRTGERFKPDAMSIHLVFNGTGSQAVASTDQEAIQALAAEVYAAK